MIFLESHSKHFLKSHRTHSLEWGLWITWDMLLHIYLKSVAETQTRALVQFRALSFNDAFLRRLHGVRRCGASRQPDLRDRVLAPMWYGLRRAQTHQVKGRSGETLLVRGERKASTFADKSPEGCGTGKWEKGRRQETATKETWEGDIRTRTADSHRGTAEINTAL